MKKYVTEKLIKHSLSLFLCYSALMYKDTKLLILPFGPWFDSSIDTHFRIYNIIQGSSIPYDKNIKAGRGHLNKQI